MNAPAEVSELTARHLAGVDRATAGLLSGLYLTGSVTLDDFRPKLSDINFVGVLERVPTEDDLDALGGVHAGLASPRPYDGVYPRGPTVLHRPAAGRPPPTYARTDDGVFSVDQPESELEPRHLARTWPLRDSGTRNSSRRAWPSGSGLPAVVASRHLAGYWANLVDR
jgi:hypothetical protein